MKSMVRMDTDVLAALHDLRWQYRVNSLSDVVALLLCEAEPDIYHEYVSEDDPEE